MSTDTENYPGELAMLRGLAGIVRVIALHGDIDELRRVVREHDIDERAAYAMAGGSSRKVATAESGDRRD
jgi:hypothetical protein